MAPANVHMSINSRRDGLSNNDATVGIISGIIAGVAGLALILLIIKGYLEKKRRSQASGVSSRSLETHPAVPGRNNAEFHETAPLQPSESPRERSESPQEFEHLYNAPLSYGTPAVSYHDSANLPMIPLESLLPPRSSRPPSLDRISVGPNLSLSVPEPQQSTDLPHPLPPPPSVISHERRSMLSSPQHHPRFVIPSRSAIRRSAHAVTTGKVEDSMASTDYPSEPSQPEPSSEDRPPSTRPPHSEEGPPPDPAPPSFIAIERHADSEQVVGLERINTATIASLLYDKSKRLSGGTATAASNVSNIKQWDAVRREMNYSPSDDHSSYLSEQS